MTRPLILIVGRWSSAVGSAGNEGVYVPRKLLDAVAASGGEPMMAWPEDQQRADRLVGIVDAVILPGGVDLDLRPFGVPEVHPEETHAPTAQDAADVTVARAALAAELPLLAICRGMQVLNVVMGGTIHQHFDDTTVTHRNSPHDFEIRTGTRLAEVLGSTRVTGYSNHHQACDRLADGLMESAIADDKIIEGFESPDGRILGVQWHPEIDAADEPVHKAVFDWLVTAAG